MGHVERCVDTCWTGESDGPCYVVRPEKLPLFVRSGRAGSWIERHLGRNVVVPPERELALCVRHYWLGYHLLMEAILCSWIGIVWMEVLHCLEVQSME